MQIYFVSIGYMGQKGKNYLCAYIEYRKNSEMIAGNYLKRLLTAAMLILVLITSCNKEEDENKTYSYFVSKEMVTSYSESYVNSLLDAASLLFEVPVDLKP